VTCVARKIDKRQQEALSSSAFVLGMVAMALAGNYSFWLPSTLIER
jgi:hypothetical protein